MNKLFDILRDSLNIEVDGLIVRDVGEKIGSLFGETGREIGKAIDDVTKEVTLKITGEDKK